ncbi:FAD binding domain-containing protein [Pseudomassariella vexata]|uniref:FAD binding domain-domain-containing protein n=1 Tax=Pseudomassariella vexata TaxID=1141098 RepID=A0A1Y2E7N7_9PEZI|nr:FAD binding domain-containing protein [Pseudomassariella vexata]ORY67447.1 FAD binding domain-domain-containing protein [Pseudomassariella vexata]
MLGKLFDASEKQPSSIDKTPGKFQFGGHFAGIPLDANKFELDRFPYRLPGPALVPKRTTIERIETVLAERAEGLGVTILRREGVTRIVTQDDESVMAKFIGYTVKCDLDDPEKKLKPGFHIMERGMYIIAFPGSLHLVDFDSAAPFNRTKELTREHVQDVLRRVTGLPNAKIATMHFASSFTDRSKQTTQCRRGRILLAGDAAHIHPPLGAQGLNVGLGDAINLGWKLAATVRREFNSESGSASNGNPGTAGLALLDTYETERHPIAAWALEWTRAQVSMLQPDLYGAAVQVLIRDLINTTDGTNLFIDRVWGLSQRYDLTSNGDGDAHALIGCSAPDFELGDDGRLGPKLEGQRGLLVDLQENGTAALKELVVGVKYEAESTIYVPDLDTAKDPLERWFGF